ncbi:unnamed protein product [Spirodela intermedia]|uniref:Uncharacterized protein n=1 Tax=Spirodela intermedia TaxID=51605 RepID=A0A7I8IN99_SPIIN|nr:unnamed protein product [Spirodela intermedia]CAA6658932.1 unnamed protein product [Spirodela intermedia]
MERRKKRKELDKARHSPKAETLAVRGAGGQALPSPHGGGLPVHLFMELTSLESSVREAAAEGLATELRKSQEEFERFGWEHRDNGTGAVPLEAEKNDGLDNCAPPVRYAVRRLIRGSPLPERQGFALGLTVVVGSVPAIRVDSIMKLVFQFLEVSSSRKGQEVRDSLIGRLFAYGALARSGRVAAEWASQKSSTSIKEILAQVTILSGKKRYLREPAVSVILDLGEELPVEVLLDQVIKSDGLREWFEKAPEKVRSRGSVFGKLLPYPFSANVFFSREHLSLLLPCFKESTFCLPRVHGIWHVLLDILLPAVVSHDEDSSSHPNSSKKQKRTRKSNSYEEIAKISHLVFDILLLLLPRLPKIFIEVVLSHKLVHCLMDILSTKSSWLYSAAQKFMGELVSWVGNDDDRRVAVILSIAKHSNCRFDCITQTNTVRGLISRFHTCSGRVLLVQNLMSLFVDESGLADEPSDASQTTDENSERDSPEGKDPAGILGNTDFLKNWIIDSLPRVLKTLKINPVSNPSDPEEAVKLGLFSASLGTEVTSFELQEKFTWPKVATSSSLCRSCIEQLQLLIEDAQKGDESRLLPSSPDSNDLGSFFMCFLNTMCNIPSVSLSRALSNEDEKAFKNLLAMETRLYQEERRIGHGLEANKLHALRYLLIQLLLQLVLRPQEFSDAAAELIICCKKAFPGLDDDGSPELMDVLMDTLLSLVPQSSSPMCYAIEQVFRFFCDDITDDGLLRILHIVKKDLKPPRRQVADADDDDSDDDDEDLFGIEDTEEANEPKTLGSEDSDDGVDDSEAVTGAKAAEEHNEKGEEPSAPDAYESDMAMMDIATLCCPVQTPSLNPFGDIPSKESRLGTRFELTTLLFLQICIEPSNPRVVMVYSYLIQAFVNSHSSDGRKQLGERIRGIMQKKIFRGKECPKGSEVEISTLEALLGKSLRLAFRSRINAVSLMEQVFEILRRLLDDYFDNKKSRVKSVFIKEVFRRHPWVARQLFDLLLEKCNGAKSEFRRIEALELVDSALKSLALSQKGDASSDASKFLKKHVPSFSRLICQLLSRFPEKQSRRAEVRRFCCKILDALTSHNLLKSFTKQLTPEAYSACESKLGNQFHLLKKPAK